MAKEISQLLKEATQGILTDETLDQIQGAFDTAVTERVKIHVEKALIEQDSEYSSKLEQLLESIDSDHAKKLTRVVEAQDSNNTTKLQHIVKHYKKIISENAEQFKSDMVDKVSHYIDLFIESKIPQESINEAVKNTKARNILNTLRESLAIDSALMSESLRGALIDGKNQIVTAQKEAADAKQQLTIVKEGLEKTQAELVLESKTQHLTEKKKEYAKRVLSGKTPKFILENIDYTLSLFDKKEDERLDTLKEQAFEKRTVKEDAQHTEDDVLTESTSHYEESQTDVKTYMNELARY